MAISGVICFGDSVLAGTGASARELGCAKRIKSALEVPTSLRARNWDSSLDGLHRLENDVISQIHFSHVIILFGNNDCWFVDRNKPRVPIKDFRENLLKMIDRIQGNGQMPILCNLQPIEPRRLMHFSPGLLELNLVVDPSKVASLQKGYSDSVKSVAEDQKVHFVDIRTPLEKSFVEIIADDGIHPNDRGHEIIAGEILKYLKIIEPELSVIN